MNSQRIAIICLFLVGFLFIICLNLGALHNDDTQLQTPPWLNGLGNTLARPQTVKLADLNPASAACLQGKLVVPIGKTCTYAITQSSFVLRVAVLRLVQGEIASVALSQENTLPVRQSLTEAEAMTSNDMKIYPGKAHGVLTVQCLNAGGASACLLALQ